jgi:hypothetical protein
LSPDRATTEADARTNGNRPWPDDLSAALQSPALTSIWEDSIDRALAQMLTSPDPLQRAIAARVILSDAARRRVLR